MTDRLRLFLIITVLTQFYSYCPAGVLVSFQPYMASGLNPVYSSTDAQHALSLGLSTNSGSEYSLTSSPYSAIKLSRTSTTGEVILNFTFTAKPGWTVTVDALQFDVGTNSVPLPNYPKMLVSSNPATDLFSGPFGFPNSDFSVGQLNLSFTPVTLQSGSSLQISTQLGILEAPALSTVNYQVPVGKSLLLNGVIFFGSVTPAAAVPEPNLTWVFIGVLSAAILRSGRVAISRLHNRRTSVATSD